MTARALVRVVLPPAVFGVALLALWEAAVEAFDFKPYFLPPPS
jgi:NitT/TauT family transport system permease protein